MSKADWKEEHLEELLKQMPKVNDNRNPDDLYQLISNNVKKKKRTSWIIPGFSSLAAIILMIILIPSFFDVDNRVNHDSIQESKSMDKAEKRESTSLKMTQDSNSNQMEALIAINKTAVYEEDLAGKELLTFGIPDKSALNVVPVSVLVNKQASKSWFDYFNEIMPILTEENWGLTDYFPLNGTWTYHRQEKTINFDVPSDHQYGLGSASQTMFERSLAMTFRGQNEIHKITLSTSNNPGINLGNSELTQIDLLAVRKDRHPYLLMYTGNYQEPLFVPTQETVPSFEAALDAMRISEPTLGLTSAIPEGLNIDHIVTDKKTAVIYFENQAEIPETPEMIYGVEAILLAAKSFDFSTVEFKHDETKQIGPFQLNTPINVPLAANKKEIQ
ncbi:negative regulator of sigma-X activity [Neobacillus sp. LXY-4]|uniref:negative regulator of sigma-X activity n=1 Tax=Neobacillus sp. LXY-4 TaxID=3379826 RepID=UPI003EDF819B